jgi:hypothetical protein
MRRIVAFSEMFCIAKSESACWHRVSSHRLHRCLRILRTGLVLRGLILGCALAQAPQAAPPAEPASAAVEAQWVTVPAVRGRLHAADIGLVINAADPYSVAVGEYYIERRGLRPDQVLRIHLPVKPVLSAAEFEPLASAIAAHFGRRTQALALAWSRAIRSPARWRWASTATCAIEAAQRRSHHAMPIRHRHSHGATSACGCRC